MSEVKGLIIECWPPRQTGGQVVGSGPAGVRITHLPSGIQCIVNTERSQHKNKSIAMDMIESALTHPFFRGPLS